MLTIDGSEGEGGGQVLRSSLAMSLVTTTPLHMVKIRAKRKKPGLMRQHLTAVQAAKQVGRAEVEGDDIGSQNLRFQPNSIAPGPYRFAVGTAGSATLVLQTVLPPLLTASARSTLTLEGGTHNPFAPPFDFLHDSFLPLVNTMGPTVTARLERPGFYPAGGGRLSVGIEPSVRLAGFSLLDRGEVRRRTARAIVSRLPRSIAERELAVVARKLGFSTDELQVEEIADPRGPGNVVMITIQSEHVTEVFTEFGSRGVRAEKVADRAADAAERYLAGNAPVGEHLADQLLIPLALAGGGSFRTFPPTQHTLTNIEVLKQFLNVEITPWQVDSDTWQIDVKAG
ncbi:MAG: RNA 3'-terminal phosphate cyclase [Phycisphaerales bacterium]|nr:MAG: RNA 3'-terminal phosphate cyclase [Phycisphaerales bacterium]